MKLRTLLPAVLLLLLLSIGVGTALHELQPESENSAAEGTDPAATATTEAAAHRSPPRVPRTRRAGERAGHADVGADEVSGTSSAGGVDPENPDLVPRGDSPEERGEERGEEQGEEQGEGEDATADAPDPEKAERIVEAVVRNAETGAPLADARVLVVVVGRGWHGTRTGADGRIVKPLTKSDLEGVERVELRVRVPGFALAVVPYDDTALEIALEPLAELPLPGRAELFVYLPDGTPFEGRVALSCYDPMSDHHGRLVRTDAAGRAILHGLEPGAWRIGVPQEQFADVHVPSGGETRVQVEKAADESLTEDEFQAAHRELQALMTVMSSDSSQSSDRPRSAEFETVRRMQTLETRWRLQRPGRDVVITGLPAARDALVRIEATHGPGQAWVLPRGEADLVIRSLPPERWRLVVVRRGERLAEHTIDVVLGEGAQEVSVRAR